MYEKVWKRGWDVMLAAALLPFFGILWLAAGAAVFVEDRGPVFYLADRLGKDGRIFKMYKFRSMRVDAPDIRNADGTTFNSEHDGRVTRTGRILRKTSLDEIPQVINILKGEMSFVGPRPDLPDMQGLYSERDRKKLRVLPGITGYSQAYYRNSSTLEQRFAGDVYYAEHVSLFLDLKIMVKTLQTVWSQKNVFRNKGEEDAD